MPRTRTRSVSSGSPPSRSSPCSGNSAPVTVLQVRRLALCLRAAPAVGVRPVGALVVRGLPTGGGLLTIRGLLNGGGLLTVRGLVGGSLPVRALAGGPLPVRSLAAVRAVAAGARHGGRAW